jgi:hypothetical protein
MVGMAAIGVGVGGSGGVVWQAARLKTIRIKNKENLIILSVRFLVCGSLLLAVQLNGVLPNDFQGRIAGGRLHEAGPNIAEIAFQRQRFGQAQATGNAQGFVGNFVGGFGYQVLDGDNARIHFTPVLGFAGPGSGHLK